MSKVILKIYDEIGIKLTQHEKLLNSDEIIRLVGIFAKFGVDKIRFTGGLTLRKFFHL